MSTADGGENLGEGDLEMTGGRSGGRAGSLEIWMSCVLGGEFVVETVVGAWRHGDGLVFDIYPDTAGMAGMETNGISTPANLISAVCVFLPLSSGGCD